MAKKSFWNDQRLFTALEAVVDHLSLAEAALTLSKTWKKSITRNALQKALAEAFPDVDLRDAVGKRAKKKQAAKRSDMAKSLIEDVEEEDHRPDYLKYSHEELRVKHMHPADPKLRGDLRYGVNEATTIHVWPDAHVPLHDPGALEACTMFAEYMVPDIVVDMGDFLDLDEVSYHPPSSVIRGGGHLYGSITPGREILRDQGERLDRAGVKKRCMIGGNHENRLHRYIVQKCPEIYEMVPTIPDMLGLKESGWDYVVYGGALRVGPVQFTHGRGHSKYVACRTMEREGSTVFGHTHRMQMFVSNTRPGFPEMAMTIGTRGKLSHDYQYHAPNDHVHGLGIVHIDTQGQVQMIPIIIHEGILKYSLPGGKTLVIDGNRKTIKEM